MSEIDSALESEREHFSCEMSEARAEWDESTRQLNALIELQTRALLAAEESLADEAPRRPPSDSIHYAFRCVDGALTAAGLRMQKERDAKRAEIAKEKP